MFAKNGKYRIFLGLLSMLFLFVVQVKANNISFTYPSNGGGYYTGAGQSSISMNITWEYSTLGVVHHVIIKLDGVNIYTGLGTSTTSSVGTGQRTLRAELWNIIKVNNIDTPILVASSEISITVIPTYAVMVQNSFGSGNVTVDGSTYSSGTVFGWLNGENHTLGAIDGQSYGGYVRRFDSWSTSATTTSIGISVSGNATYTATFLKEFNIGFQNNYPGYGGGGVINVNGSQYSSPTSAFPVKETYTISGGVVNTYQVINGIEYTFASWSPGGSTSSSTTFTPTDHTGYSANFNAKPLPPPGIAFVGITNDPIQLAWSAHPSSGVTQYQIWRIVKPKNQNQGAPQLIATIGGSATSYIDYDYTYTAGYTNDLLNYDVRAYFSPSGTYADPNYLSVFGRIGARQVEDGDLASTAGELPTSYAVSNFPNPFNPSTTISYQLVEEAGVTLEIYDVMGRKISSLLQEQKQAGYYTARWEGKDNSGNQVATGAYLYRFTAAPTSGKQPFTKSGKLLLTK